MVNDTQVQHDPSGVGHAWRDIECAFCDTTVETVGDAIAADWVPGYWIGEEACPDPVCPACAAKRLRQADDGELELIE